MRIHIPTHSSLTATDDEFVILSRDMIECLSISSRNFFQSTPAPTPSASEIPSPPPPLPYILVPEKEIKEPLSISVHTGSSKRTIATVKEPLTIKVHSPYCLKGIPICYGDASSDRDNEKYFNDHFDFADLFYFGTCSYDLDLLVEKIVELAWVIFKDAGDYISNHPSCRVCKYREDEDDLRMQTITYDSEAKPNKKSLMVLISTLRRIANAMSSKKLENERRLIESHRARLKYLESRVQLISKDIHTMLSFLQQ